MLLSVTENLELATGSGDAWQLLRDTERLARLVGGVQSVEPIESPGTEAYRVVVMEKVGPFKVIMNLEVAITETVELQVLGATIKGSEPKGGSRATGTVRVELTPSPAGTAMRFIVNVEILGKLATLGAPVIRRRVNELFSDFGKRVVAEFAVGAA